MNRVPNLSRDMSVADAVAAIYAVWPASEPFGNIAEFTDGSFAITFERDGGIERGVLGMNLVINGWEPR